MKRFNLTSLVVALVASSMLFSCTQEEETLDLSEDFNLIQSSSQPIEGQYIVVYNTDKTGHAGRLAGDYARANNMVVTQTQDMLTEKGISGEIVQVYSQTINGVTLQLTEEDVNKLRNDDRVAYIEQDRIVALAPPWERGDDGGGSTGEEVPYGITRVKGGVTYTGSNVAWIIDTGIDLDHEDLNVDASRGYNAFTKGKDGKDLDDGNGHGTHVAGTVAAIDNEVGVIGVAAGATVIPVKVLDSRGSGSYSGVIAGVDHVGANGSNGDVANMSLGGPVSQALDDAVLAASQNGIKFSLAAGNESADANNSSPARVNGSNIVTISAMDDTDTFASFSNYANPPVDYCAPGVSIKSTWKDGGYNTISGTSMAAPHAAGVLLLGNASTDGTVNGDPDGNADPIIVH
ncbi:MAG: S8 family peptidase [Fulvivirga sp.]|nr:S8 family peptidase [Fulvivirga sp.]